MGNWCISNDLNERRGRDATHLDDDNLRHSALNAREPILARLDDGRGQDFRFSATSREELGSDGSGGWRGCREQDFVAGEVIVVVIGVIEE